MSEQLFLIDGSSYLFRAYHAIRSLSTSKGFPTNAIYGFTQMLLKALREQRPSHVAVVFDLPGPTFRDALYPAYKAHRPPSPDDLVAQIPKVKEITRLLGVPLLEAEGFEADDVIGTLAHQAVAEGLACVIVTGDKDLMQLVGPHVTLFDSMKNRTIGVAEVRERFGVGPERVVDVLALAGDASDNIPGVEGVGEVTAAKLVAELGGVEDILARLDRVSRPKLRESLRRGAEQARLSRTLATVRTDVPLRWAPRDLRPTLPDAERLRAVFTELEFSRWAQSVAPAKTVSTDGYRLVSERAALETLVAKLRACEAFALDTETTSKDPMRAALVGISVAVADGEAYYVPVGHRRGPPLDPRERRRVEGARVPRSQSSQESDAAGPDLWDLGEARGTAEPGPAGPAQPPSAGPEGGPGIGDLVPAQLPLQDVLDALRPVLEAEAPGKIGQNLKYDCVVLERHGIRLRGIAGDAMLASYVLHPSRPSHGLEALAREFLGHQIITYEDVAGKGKRQVTFDQVDIERAKAYSCEDADVALRVARRLEAEVRAQDVWRLYAEVELPLLEVLAELERNGVRVDRGALEALGRDLGARLDGLVREIHALAGEPFNLDSPKQLQRILFDRLGLERGRRTQTGYSTDVDVLSRLAAAHPIAARLLEYRGVAKLKNTYADALPQLIHPLTGRIHTSYNQTATATGRLSSSDPNLQNIPVRTAEGRLIRRAFVPEDGGCFVSADYSQIELRVLAHLSGDPVLREAFRREEDVHTRTAAELFGTSPEAVAPDQRRRAKIVNFGILYGMSDHGLAQELGIPHAEARDMIARYFARYAGVKAYLDRVLEEARATGAVTTLLKRRRYLPDLRSPHPNVRALAERMAVNTPIQGTAADIMKVAMIRVARRLRRDGGRARPILQVHDELVVEAPSPEADTVKSLLREEMEGAVSLDVPLKVDVSSGPNWAELS